MKSQCSQGAEEAIGLPDVGQTCFTCLLFSWVPVPFPSSLVHCPFCSQNIKPKWPLEVTQPSAVVVEMQRRRGSERWRPREQSGWEQSPPLTLRPTLQVISWSASYSPAGSTVFKFPGGERFIRLRWMALC